MKIVFEIPKEFESHFEFDRFSDSLARVASDIEALGFKMSGRYERETITMIRKAFENATPLPKGHGRLIDADAFIDGLRDSSKRQRYNECLIDELLTVDDVFQAVIESLENKGLAEGDAPTIIEADKEGAEDGTDKQRRGNENNSQT